MSGGRPGRPDHNYEHKCYGCGEKAAGRMWLYKGTKMALCDSCHEFTQRKEDRDPVDIADLVWRSEADKFLRRRV